MKTKSFNFGAKTTGKTYFKAVGKGWETGFVFAGKPVFVGNFIHQKEALVWFGMLNKEVSKFSKKYGSTGKVPATWFAHFFGNHLYKSYYGFLDRLFAKYNRNYSKAVVQDLRRFSKLKSHNASMRRTPFSRAA